MLVFAKARENKAPKCSKGNKTGTKPTNANLGPILDFCQLFEFSVDIPQKMYCRYK